jgi:hypothetical protein
MATPPPGDGLALHLDAVAEDVFEPDFVASAPLLRFEAFLEHEHLFGWVHLDAARLTDLLNAHDALHLYQPAFESLVDGSTRREEELVVPRSSIIAVSVTGPRGDPALRRWTHSHPVAVQLGEFLMGGYAHATPDEDPRAAITERQPMVPLTDAWLEHWPGGQLRRKWIGTMIFNRDRTDWVRIVAEEELELGLIRPSVTLTAS